MDQQKQTDEGQELDLPSIQQEMLEEQPVQAEMAVNVHTCDQSYATVRLQNGIIAKKTDQLLYNSLTYTMNAQ